MQERYVMMPIDDNYRTRDAVAYRPSASQNVGLNYYNIFKRNF